MTLQAKRSQPSLDQIFIVKMMKRSMLQALHFVDTQMVAVQGWTNMAFF